MDLKHLIENIKRVALSLKNETPDLKFYIFGSIIKDSSTVTDIDILVIYQNHEDLIRIRESYELISMLFPLDFVFLNANEEKYFDFIKVTGANQILKQTI